MYTYTLKHLPKNTIEILVKTPWDDLKGEYAKSFEALRKELSTEGFRKGKVPTNIAESKIPKSDIYDHALRSYIPKAYGEILKKEDVRPIVAPKIELVTAKENEDWEIKISTATTPDVKLGKYKEKIKDAKATAKKDTIWVPGKSKEPTPEEKEKQTRAEFQAALTALLAEAKVEISDLLIEDELQGRLSRLVDDVQRVGLTMEAYFKSKNLTKEDVTAQLKKEIEETYKTEFILQQIADEEHIQVEQEEITKVLEGIKDEKEKKTAQENMYYYASLMRKQKVLDFINSL